MTFAPGPCAEPSPKSQSYEGLTLQPVAVADAAKETGAPANAVAETVAAQETVQAGAGVVGIGQPAVPCQQCQAALSSGTNSPVAFSPPAPVGWLSSGALA